MPSALIWAEQSLAAGELLSAEQPDTMAASVRAALATAALVLAAFPMCLGRIGDRRGSRNEPRASFGRRNRTAQERTFPGCTEAGFDPTTRPLIRFPCPAGAEEVRPCPREPRRRRKEQRWLAARPPGWASLAACAALLWWLLFSVFLAVFRCGDNCAGAEAEHWRWAAQLAIAAVGSGLGVSALVLGFTAKQRRYRACVTVSTGCVVVWVGWVFVGGNF